MKSILKLLILIVLVVIGYLFVTQNEISIVGFNEQPIFNPQSELDSLIEIRELSTLKDSISGTAHIKVPETFMRLLQSYKSVNAQYKAEGYFYYDIRAARMEIMDEERTIVVKDVSECKFRFHCNVSFLDIKQNMIASFKGDELDKIKKDLEVKLEKQINTDYNRGIAEANLESYLRDFLCKGPYEGYEIKIDNMDYIEIIQD